MSSNLVHVLRCIYCISQKIHDPFRNLRVTPDKFFSQFQEIEIHEILIKRIYHFLFLNKMKYRAEIWYTCKVILSLLKENFIIPSNSRQ